MDTKMNGRAMRSIVFLLSVNVLWVGVNLRMAWTGKQDLLWVLNTAYDFAIWAALIIFGVMNMVSMLWDRRLCDGLPPSKDRDEIYKKCDGEMLKLLVVETVAVNLGLLVAVLHFILLIARCCTQPTRNAEYRSIALRTRIREEEEHLEILIERRRWLVRENDALEWRRNRPLPPPPYEADALPHEENENDQTQETETRQQEDDLIDMATNGQEVTKQGSAETPAPDNAATSTTHSDQ
ncbi:hypothetical protein B0O99DRAFT_299413 [Bisporella sp. PMI_857]|nr:hypothetical protein B0O99DRAFT_299413 [Bisporella sp. PMI_857]